MQAEEDDDDSSIDGEEDDQDDDLENLDIDQEDESSDDEEFDLASHKLELEKLKETDPTFYQYLAENDQALLDVKEDESDDDEPMEETPKIEQVLVTKQMVLSWKSSCVEKKSLKALKCLLMAFKSAIAFIDTNKKGGNEDDDTLKYRIANHAGKK